jgi:toxin ParE1/3/4
MKYSVRIFKEAHGDVEAAYNYYESQKEGLGEEFLIELINRFDDLAEHPNHYSFLEGQDSQILRDVSLLRFPFVIIFEIIGYEVLVYAVHNTNKQRRL